jgi:ABC-2 type transport system permease protein
MSTMTEARSLGAVGIDPRRPGIPMSRLVRVETRKLVDTRAGFWLVAAMVAACAAVLAGALVWARPDTLDYQALFGFENIPLGVVLPVLAVLLVTSEWSQRTALLTFTVEPRRARVVRAKLVTCLLAAAVAIVVTLALAALGCLLAGVVRHGAGSAGAWDMSWHLGLYASLAWFLALAQGFGFGMLLRNSAAGIVAVFVAPVAWTGITTAVPWVHRHIQAWIDYTTAETPFRSARIATGAEWAHLGVAAAIWVVLPVLIGTRLLLRAEVK